jgi:cellulose synthase/poly-beta-1,6-N-acetylglucosamine synthase-like glycosyltransferase
MNIVEVDSFSTRGSPYPVDPAPFARRRETATPSPERGRRRVSSGPKGDSPHASLPAEIAFLGSRGTPFILLRYAAALARRQGVSADAVLIAEELIREEDFYRALAAHLGAQFFDEEMIISLENATGSECGLARLAENKFGLRWAIAPRGDAIVQLIEAAQSACGRPLFAIIPPSRLFKALSQERSEHRAHQAAYSAKHANPGICARDASSRSLLAAAFVGNAALFAGLFASYAPISSVATLFYATAFLAAVFLRLFACVASFKATEHAPEIDEARLPNYSIIIPLYDEASVVPQLTKAINRLDYPRAKLEVKFVVEHDDAETIQALRVHAPRAPHEIIVAPPGAPLTKPRALNVAALDLRGDIVAVFDAEDLPEADQLKKAAAAFAQAPMNVACLQASLSIDNGDENWMTALYALDYAALFDVFNKGVAAMGAPLFLGGTSNHFRIEALRGVGFWDAFNVTEDADLGLRLARAGYSVKTIASRTFEEAPANFDALLRQRARWMKGWMQTALAHWRRPLQLFADLGAYRALATFAMFAGSVVGPLLTPALAVLLIQSVLHGRLLAPATPLEILGSTSACFLALSGACAILWPMIVGMRRQGLCAYWPALFFLPLWMLMLSLAAWRALFELWRRAHHWEKTAHGLARRGSAPMDVVNYQTASGVSQRQPSDLGIQ